MSLRRGLPDLRKLFSRGVKDWATVSFGAQYVQKYNPSERADILKDFLQANPDHKFAKLYRSILGSSMTAPNG